MPFLVISPWAKRGAVDHTLTDFSSVDKLIEDNWSLPRIPGSFDASAGSIDSMFNFKAKGADNGNGKLLLNPITGQPYQGGGGGDDQGDG